MELGDIGGHRAKRYHIDHFIVSQVSSDILLRFLAFLKQTLLEWVALSVEGFAVHRPVCSQLREQACCVSGTQVSRRSVRQAF